MNKDDVWWMEYAACKRLAVNPIIFYPLQGRRPHITEFAKKVCSICSVRTECLTYALDNGIEDGIWGGQTKSERRHLRRTRIMLDSAPLPQGESAYG